MKFWKRIFIYSMSLFLIVFNGAGLFIIENIHKRSIDRTIKLSLDEQKSLEGILYLNADSLQIKNTLENNESDISFATDYWMENQLKDWIALVISSYVYIDQMAPKYIEIYNRKNHMVFSNLIFDLKTERSEILQAKTNERSFTIRNFNNKYYLFISSQLKVQQFELKIILTKDINYIYEERIQNYRLFLISDAVITLVLAMGMYLISKKVTNPIVKLSNISKEVAKGNYTHRVNVKNRKDEIASLADNFNTMIQATKNTIEELKNLNHSKQRFIDSLTHELKTPLTSIIGYSDLILKGNINEEIKITALNYINSEAKRLEKLSFTLLKLILIKEEGLNYGEISIKECVLTAYKTLSYKLDEKNISLNLDLDDFILYGDNQLIAVLLINLLDNSIKASNNLSEILIKGIFDEL